MRIGFAGTPAFAATALAALLEGGHEPVLVLTQPARPAGRGLRPQPGPVEALARKRGIELFQPTTLKDPEAVRRITAARPAVLVVAAYGLILPQAVLETAPEGAINIHASLLPRWRGAAPIQRAILAGDPETGITIMRMDAGLDTGPILLQQATPIGAADDAQSLHDRLAAMGGELIVQALRELHAGRLHGVAQPHAGATYAPKIARAETVIDWSLPAIHLERAVRAFSPSPGVSTTCRGEGLKIWKCRRVAGRGEPGEILGALSRGALCVACGSEALELLELQRAGGRRLATGEFLRGCALRAGERLGAAG